MELFTIIRLVLCLSICCIGLQATSQQQKSDGDNYDSAWSWKKAFIDLGIYDSWVEMNAHVRRSVQAAQKYTDEELLRDWSTLKANPGIKTLFNFVRNSTLPMIVRFVSEMYRLWNSLYVGVMKFTRKKCDAFLGKEAPLHPWNVMKLEKETVSMLVFLYGFALSLILMKLCSLWNFIAWLAIGYLAYAIGGPYWLFRWLVFITGFFWYSFDLIVTYPYYCAALFLIFYMYFYYSRSDEIATAAALPREIRTLTEAVDDLERKTDSIEKKIDRLAEVLER